MPGNRDFKARTAAPGAGRARAHMAETAGLSPPLASLPRRVLLRRHARGLEHRRPAGDLALDELLEPLRAAIGAFRDDAAELEQALAHGLVRERLVERVDELCRDLLRRALRREDRVPGADLVVGQAA